MSTSINGGGCSSTPASDERHVQTGRPALKKIPSYWYPYRTNAKARWFDREILEVISTEFRDRSVEYYKYALQSGVTTINGKIALPGTIIRNGDTLENIVHRHEPPVTSTPVEILHHDEKRGFIVINKPGSIPVHAAGRYFKNSLVEILKNDFGFKNVHTVNRLDRLTSGLMIIALSPDCARTLTSEFTSGTIRKEYVARVRGEFPAYEITCEEPLLTVDRQMGLNIVHPEGKEARTVFKRMHYDKITDTSVVHCRPFTGRSHQIRVHLQYLGHPIANDSVYAETRIWGPHLGIGGIDLAPSEEREAPRPPASFSGSTAEGQGRTRYVQGQLVNEDREASSSRLDDHSEDYVEESQPISHAEGKTKIPRSRSAAREKKREARKDNPAYRSKEESADLQKELANAASPLLPRETGHDIGLGSPVPLSLEAVEIITRMRNQKDEDEDWSRWRDVVFRAKGSLIPLNFKEGYAEQRPVPKRKAKRGQATRPQRRILADGDAVIIPKRDDHGPVSSTERTDSKHSAETPSWEDQSTACIEQMEGELVASTGQMGITYTHDGDETTDHRVLTEGPIGLSNSLRIAHDCDDRHETNNITSPPDPDPSPSCDSQKPLNPFNGLPQEQDAYDESSTGAPLPVAEFEADRDALYCPECYLPLHPDPKPEKLYIFLHALRYTSASLGAFETSLPEWAAEGYTWE